MSEADDGPVGSALWRSSGDGLRYRDLNGNGRLDPYEDPRLPVEVRVADLLARMSLEDKAGMLFHTVIETGPGGSLLEGPGVVSSSATSEVVLRKRMNHVNVHRLPEPRLAARWANRLQALAEQTPLGIPVTVSSDPRHAFQENAGASFTAGHFSQWPEMLGFAAIGETELVARFADVVRREYLAVGIRAALHPCLDLATEPRWARQQGTFGEDPHLVSRLGAAYLDAMQGPGGRLGPAAVACTAKHFPGGGPQRDGEDAHFPYGREQVYPGGRFEDHLAPFAMAVRHGVAAVMPYYGMPVGLEVDGEPVAEVGFSFNPEIVTGLLRGRLGFDGVVVTDWELVHDNRVADGSVLPARAWGVEHLPPADRVLRILAAGCDQLGGEECTDLLLDLVRDGRVTEARLDVAVRRLLAVKFRLGLVDDPFVDEDAAARAVGGADAVRDGLRAQSRSVTVLADDGVLPIRPGTRVLPVGLDPEAADGRWTPVGSAREAEVAVVRVAAPWEPRDELFLERWFHAGSLDFDPQTVERVLNLAREVPVVLDVSMDRPAILTPFLGRVAALVASYGSSDRALCLALSGQVAPVGRLPFELPRTMAAVSASRPDVGSDTADPLFPRGHGLAVG